MIRRALRKAKRVAPRRPVTRSISKGCQPLALYRDRGGVMVKVYRKGRGPRAYYLIHDEMCDDRYVNQPLADSYVD